jgi:SAM-dependent methyltransferase
MVPQDPNHLVPDENYRSRVAIETENYQNNLNVHELPGIFDYWSNTFVRPKAEALGIGPGNEMFHSYLKRQCQRGNGAKRFVSLGSGNCDLEIDFARRLRAEGYTDFVIECLDLNAQMLERGRMAAAKEQLEEQLHFVQTDFNEWTPAHEYDAVLGIQALHHVLQLESVFSHIKSSLKPDGCFMISDIIGRNGHQRWPEALDIVHEFWPKLPPTYRYNRQLRRYEEMFEDWDCSMESFEGIRSQDILPLLVDQFSFHVFLGFANVIDPFVDRSFGPNFDATAEWDRSFIAEINRRDEQEIFSGRVKPTHMLAVVGNKPASHPIFQEPLSPKFCVRSPAASANARAVSSREAYQPDAWPRPLQHELSTICGWLNDSEYQVQRLTNEVARLEQLSQERTAWALKLDTELEEMAERTAWAQRLDNEVGELNAELENRTAWAQRLNTEVEESNALAQQLAKDLEERTAWALQLDGQLKSLGLWGKVAQRLSKIFPRRDPSAPRE